MTTTDPTTDAYLRTRVMTASPEELRLLLLDGSLRFARQGRHGIVEHDHEATFEGITQCRAIIAELLTTIRDDVESSLAERVKSVYGFLFRELAEIGISREDNRLRRLDRVIELLDYERETWVLVMEQVTRETASPQSTPIEPTAGSDRAPLSIEA